MNIDNNHNLRTKEIIITLLLLVVIAGSYFGFKYYQKMVLQKKINQNIQQISDSALKVKVSDSQKLQSLNELYGQSSSKISPEEAEKREAEIINQLNSN